MEQLDVDTNCNGVTIYYQFVAGKQTPFSAHVFTPSSIEIYSVFAYGMKRTDCFNSTNIMNVYYVINVGRPKGS